MLDLTLIDPGGIDPGGPSTGIKIIKNCGAMVVHVKVTNIDKTNIDKSKPTMSMFVFTLQGSSRFA